MRAGKPITVTLGDQRDDIERAKRILDDVVAHEVRQALDDLRPFVPARDAFDRIQIRHTERLK